jgi:hypothetical protein
MALRYLDFDYSEDTEDIGVFEAMATTSPQQAAAVQAEIVQVLAWAHEAFPGRRGPLVDGGGEWDYDLQAKQELTVPQTLEFDEATRRLEVRTGPAGTPRHTVTLAISGTPAFCAAFRDRFGLG